MIQEKKIFFNLKDLKIESNKLSKKLKKGSVVCLKGELGSGKTTFARFLINNIYDIKKLKKPSSIKSPTFPILLTYNLSNLEIFHYDLYRIENNSEFYELNIEENIKNSITLVEWPEIMLKNNFIHDYFIIEFKMYSSTTRKVKIKKISKINNYAQ